MKPRRRVALAICALVIASSGCIRGPLSWQRVTLNRPISQEDVAFVVDGTTTLTDVIGRLGAPDEIRPGNGVIVARYHFTDGRYFRADYGWGLRFLLPFLAPDLVLGGGGLGTDIFQVVCDSRWVVQEHAFAWHANSAEFRLWPFDDSAKRD